MRAQSNLDALDLAIGIKDEAKKAAVLAALAEYSVHAAAFVGKADLVAAAIANGADVNAPHGVTRLFVCVCVYIEHM